MTNSNSPSDHPTGPVNSPGPTQGPHPGPPPGVPARPGMGHRVAVPRREPGPFRRGFGLGAGAGAGLGLTLIVLGTILSLLSAIALATVGAVSAAREPMPATMTTAWGDPSAAKTLRAIDIQGAILNDASQGSVLGGGAYGYEIARTLDELTAEDADGVILRINSPGGTITGSRAISDAVVRYRDRTGRKVFAHVQGLSASGGMYAMATADDIRADYGSLVGSIGVIFGPLQRYYDVTAVDGGLLAGGVTAGRIEEFYLTQGRGKDAGQPYRDLTEEERGVLTQALEIQYAAFVDHVANARGIAAQTIRDDLGAHLYDGVTATDSGLIDGVMNVDSAYRHFATLAGLEPVDTKVVAAAAPTFLGSLLGAEKRIPGQALSVAAQPGVRPVTAAAVCGPAPVVLAYHGNVAQVCG